jgi:histone deacetylase 1/2
LIKSWGLPLLVLGGGGYTIKNVARCWAYETSICLGMDLDNSIPNNDFYEFYGPDCKLHFNVRFMIETSIKYRQKLMNKI